MMLGLKTNVVCCGQLGRCDLVCERITICHDMKFVTIEAGGEINLPMIVWKAT